MKNKRFGMAAVVLVTAAMFCMSCGQNEKEAEETAQMAEAMQLQPDEIEILSSM